GLSSLGALITLLSLAIDAFTQQITGLEDNRVMTDGKAIAQVQWFYFNMNTTRTSEQTAAYSAIFGDSGFTTPFSCPSVDCSWDPYETLGCAANVRLGKLEETFLPWSWWNTTVPEFSNARFGGIESYQLMPSRDDWKARYPTQSLIDPTKNNTVNPVSTTIQPGPKFVERSSHENLSEWLCSLFDAIFSFENVLAMPPIYHGATEVAYKFRDSTYKMMGSDSGQTTSEDAETDSMSLIFEHLAESVTQAIRQQVFNNESDRIGGGRSKNRVDVRPSSMSNDLFENVDYEPNAVATGTVFENRAVVRVHWRGLLFPAALLLLTVIVTISTKIRSLQQGIPDWGSSMMPLMLRGPYSCAVDACMSYTETNAQMDRLAKTTKVSLQRTGSGWNLVEQRTVEETARA
ncbi:MAG: hypothetical protein Q9205_007670, partial [Flavoplaca limonia]